MNGGMKKFLSLTGFLVALLVLATAIEASDNSTVNFGANSNITAHSTCKKVTNNSGTGLSVYVPTQTSAEWTSFYSNLPAGITAASCGPLTTQVIFLTSGSSWTVPADWNSANNTIEVIGGGGNGGGGGIRNGGGGGGAYSKITNLNLASGALITYAVGGAGVTTYFNGTSCGTSSVCAVGGTSGSGGGAGGGGSAASGVGTVRYSGGSGSASAGGEGGGGGGAAGPNGNGGNGAYTGVGGGNGGSSNGGATGGGGGGPNPAGSGGSGTAAVIWTQTSNGATAGSGSGGGGSAISKTTTLGSPGAGGWYGGGGGGPGINGAGSQRPPGAGGSGIIVIKYGP
jgi:hypothetical protein